MQQILFAGFLTQLFWATLALAAPVETITTTTLDNTWQYGTGGGILGFIVLVLDILVFSAYNNMAG